MTNQRILNATRLKSLSIAAFAASLNACAPQGLYYWGDYSQSLYDYQADPTTIENYRAALEEIIEKSDKRPVPPGIRAELGYLSLVDGDPGKAVALFVQEQKAWPESAAFMRKAIDLANGGPAETPAITEPEPQPELLDDASSAQLSEGVMR